MENIGRSGKSDLFGVTTELCPYGFECEEEVRKKFVKAGVCSNHDCSQLVESGLDALEAGHVVDARAIEDEQAKMEILDREERWFREERLRGC